MTNTLLLEQQSNGVYTLTFNRPDVLNALDLATMKAFAAQVDALQHDEALRVLIVTGAGERAFCSGGDLHDLSARPTEADARHFITIMGDALLALERLPVPVIAAINGYALGGGSEIALACDMRIVDTSVRMGFVQINMALTPGWGAGQRLLQLVGYSKALELLLRGTRWDADDLLALGLANQIAEQGQALTVARQFADEIAARPSAVVQSIKTLLQASRTQRYDDALQAERALFPPLWAAEEHLSAVAAFLQRQAQKARSSQG